MDNFDKLVSGKVKRYLNKNVQFSEEERENIRQKTVDGHNRPRKFHPGYWVVLAAAASLLLFLTYSFLENPEGELPGPESAQLTADGPGLEEVEKIDFEIKEEIQLDEINRKYTIELTNGSGNPIVEGKVYLSHPIKTENGTQGNPFKAEKNLSGEIEPGETIEIELSVPSGIFDPEQIELGYESIELTGYLDEVAPQNLFQTGKSNSCSGNCAEEDGKPD